MAHLNWQCLFWCLKHIRMVLFSLTDSRFKQPSKFVFPQRISVKGAPQWVWKYSGTFSKGTKGFGNIIPSLSSEMHVNMLCSSVFRLLSAGLPPQRLVSVISCRRRLVRGAGACSCVGLEHGLGGGNGGSVQNPLSGQKHQTLWHLGSLLREWQKQHNWTSPHSNARTAR